MFFLEDEGCDEREHEGKDGQEENHEYEENDGYV